MDATEKEEGEDKMIKGKGEQVAKVAEEKKQNLLQKLESHGEVIEGFAKKYLDVTFPTIEKYAEKIRVIKKEMNELNTNISNSDNYLDNRYKKGGIISDAVELGKARNTLDRMRILKSDFIETNNAFHMELERNKKFIYHIEPTSADNADLYAAAIVPKDESQVGKLSDLLQSKYGLHISTEELSLILPEYYKKAKINEFEQIFSKITKTYPTFIEKYITYFGEKCATRETFLFFYEFLKKNDLVQKGEIKKVARDVIAGIKNQELNSFEKQLKSNNRVTLNMLDKLDGKGFENTLKTIFENQGYAVTVTTHSHDQGADLILEKFGKKIAVQAKRYENGVPNKAVQEIVAAKNHYGCDEAWVVTNSYLTQSAIELAESNDVRVIDRDELKKML